MKIECRDDLTFRLRRENQGLFVLEINTSADEIEIWIVVEELETLKEVLNV